MKKKILGLALLASATMLTSCMYPEQNSNDAVLQNALKLLSIADIVSTGLEGVGVGINASDIPGFNNVTVVPPTQVTVAISNGSAGCTFTGSNLGSVLIIILLLRHLLY